MKADIRGNLVRRVVCPSCFKDLGKVRNRHRDKIKTCQRCNVLGEIRDNWQMYVPVLDKNGVLKMTYLTTGTKDQNEAEQVLKDYLNEFSKRKFDGKPMIRSSKDGMLFRELVRDFFTWCDKQWARSLPPTKQTTEHYRSKMNHILPYLGDKLIHEVKRQMIEDFLDSRMDAPYAVNGDNLKNLKGKTIGFTELKHEHKVLRRFLQWCVDVKKCLEYNPADRIPIPENPEKKDARLRKKAEGSFHLTHDEVRKMLVECDRLTTGREGKIVPVYPPHVRMIIMLILCTGMRITEVLSLRWRDIDFEKDTFCQKVKMGKYGVFVITPHLKAAFERYKRESKISSLEWVFPNAHDASRRKDGHTNYGLKTLCKRAGIKMNVTNHTLRHTFTTLSFDKAENEGEKKEIQVALNHENSIMMDTVYSHGDLERRRKFFTKVGDYLFGETG